MQTTRTSTTTTAYVIEAFGERGTLRDVPLPPLEERDVLIRVAGIGVNPWDWMTRDGANPDRSLPTILGQDFSGIVEATGSAAQELHGRRVFGVVPTGTYAREIVVSVDGIVSEIPQTLELAAASALQTPGLTALAALEQLAGATTLLIIGSGGAVGRIVAQIASARGIAWLGLGPGGDLHATLARASWKRVDAVLDTAGNVDLLEELPDVVHRGGRVITTRFVLDTEWFDEKGIAAENLNAPATRFFSAEGLHELTVLVDQGIVRPHVDAFHPFVDALDVLDGLEAGTLPGKHVITPE
jgi:NADPH:quinone reductase-like Zn-dependent oxidoreductase